MGFNHWLRPLLPRAEQFAEQGRLVRGLWWSLATERSLVKFSHEFTTRYHRRDCLLIAKSASTASDLNCTNSASPEPMPHHFLTQQSSKHRLPLLYCSKDFLLQCLEAASVPRG